MKNEIRLCHSQQNIQTFYISLICIVICLTKYYICNIVDAILKTQKLKEISCDYKKGICYLYK